MRRPHATPDDAAGVPGGRASRVVQKFLATEAAGGIVLLVAAVAALVWANSPWSASYRTLWGTELSVRLGGHVLSEDLQHWVNDGLMAIFFFVIGLEVKRELVHGDLRDPRAAAMPAIAAAGGMAVPALFFLLATAGGAGSHGWGIPMATDIAFAVGMVAVLGSRVPASMRLFLLTLAIVDDVGAIVVIAVFYSGDLQPGYFAVAVALVAAMLGLRRSGIVWLAPYVVLGVGVWLATQASGVHATIAGVALGLLAPAGRVAGSSVSPAERLERLLHPWTTFGIVPLFALANAGVAIKAKSFDAPGAIAVTTGVVVGLVVGKTVGITAAAWLAVRSGLGRLPQGATWPMMAAIAAVAGIGFTVSVFISELAFGSGALQDAAKIGVLGGSTLAAVLGAVALVRTCPEP